MSLDKTCDCKENFTKKQNMKMLMKDGTKAHKAELWLEFKEMN